MFCPNCGNKTSTNQNFCRACGLGLEKIANSLTEQLPTKPNLSLQEKKDKFEKLGMVTLSVFGFGILAFLVYSVGYKLLLTKGDVVAALGILGFLIMVACGISSVIFFAKAKEAGDEATKRQPQSLAGDSEPTKELLTEGHFEPVPSVTDRTTDLLVAEKRDSQRR